MNKEVENRLRNYDNQDIDYTERRYSLEGMVYYSKVRSIIFSKLIEKNFKGQEVKVLDVGCGTCVLINQMSLFNKKLRFTGLDFSKKMLKNNILSSKIKTRTNLLQGSAFDLPFEEEMFDVVISSRFIHQYSDSKKKELINEMQRVVKPGGLLIVEYYSPLPRMLRNPLRLFRFSFNEELMKHFTSRRTLEKLYDKPYIIEPLTVPYPSFFVKLGGLSFFTKLGQTFRYWGLDYLFEQYLVIIRK